MNVGAAMKVLAKDARISAAEISRRTGLSESYLSMLFNAKIEDPQLSKVYAIAEVLGVTVDELVRYAREN